MSGRWVLDALSHWLWELVFPTTPDGSRCPKCRLVRRLKGPAFKDFQNHYWGIVECGCGLAFRYQGKLHDHQ
jgi:hypothetical protein